MDEIKAETELPVMRGRLRSSTKADGCSLLLTLNLYKQKQNKKKKAAASFLVSQCNSMKHRTT